MQPITFHDLSADLDDVFDRLDALLPQVAGTAVESNLWVARDGLRQARRIVFLLDRKRLPEAERLILAAKALL